MHTGMLQRGGTVQTLVESRDDEPASVDVLARYVNDGRSWVAVEDSDVPIGLGELEEPRSSHPDDVPAHSLESTAI